MKTRAPRQKVHIAARMRDGTSWTDICIKNLSSRGLMAESKTPPAPRTYVEIRRGQQTVVGRVMWARGGSFGLRSQDVIDMNALVSEPRLATRPPSPGKGAPNANERRARSRTRASQKIAATADRSRQSASALQFVALGVAAALAAYFLGSLVLETLSRPLRAVEANLPG